MDTSKENAGLDEEFIASQRERLERMLDRYRGDQNELGEEGFEAAAGGAEDAYGDDADDSDAQTVVEVQLDFDVTSDAEAEQHIEAIERALEKIEEGSYGLSDDSGELIPRARLESVPQARYTLAEQEARERPELD